MAQLSEVHPGNYVFYGVWMCWIQHNEKVRLYGYQSAGVISNGFRCTAVCDWLMQPGGRGCEGIDEGDWTLSPQEPAAD